MSLGGGQNNMLELLELAGHLRNEKLFIAQERKTLHGLFASLDESSREVHGLNWILQQQRCITADLILGSPNMAPEVCFAKFNMLEEAKFMDGYKLLTHHEIRIGRFLKAFRESPEMVALCLFRAEESGKQCLQQTTRTIMLQLYGGLLLPEDENLATSALKNLLHLQVNAGKVQNPVKLVSKGTSAFYQAFRFLTECLPSSKPFLTVAFHDPTVALLAEDEWLYDIDPEKALSRFSRAELAKRFGTPGTEQHQQKVEAYRSRIVSKLALLVERFLRGLEFSMPIFPRSLATILKEAYNTFCRGASSVSERELSNESQKYWSGSSGRSSADLDDPKKSRTSEASGKVADDELDRRSEAKRACLYLLLNIFICPAVCDPEIKGVVLDIPVGNVARHNLMQIARLLQVLALAPFEEGVDPKFKDFCEKFDKDCLSFLLDSIICNKVSNDTVNSKSGGTLGCHGDDSAREVDHPQRSSILISPQEFVDLMELVHATASSSSSLSSNMTKSQQELKELVASTNLPPVATIRSCCLKYIGQSLDASSPSVKCNSGRNLVSSYSPSIGGRKLMTSEEDLLTRSTSITRNGTTSRQPHRGVYKAVSSYNCSGEGQKEDHPPNEVLVINLGVYSECPGMLSEQKVFEHELKSRKQKLQVNSVLPGEDEHTKQCSGNLLVSGKRTRFSLSHDTDSIEPNNEGVSEEAVSSHSTDDDNDDNSTDDNDDNSNDNLSDMAYSANLSGRNTPSMVSGRDTPVSLVSGGVGGGGVSSAGRSGGGCGCDDDDDDRMVIAEVIINGGSSAPASRGAEEATLGGGDALPSTSAFHEEASAPRCSGVVSVVVAGGGGGGSGGREQARRKREQARRDDVTDKFGKFDIKQDIELEAKSTVSDTWSTDVLASDSEPPPEQNHLVRLEEVVEENVILPPRGGVGGGMGAAVSETGISETASDAWSTDVLASDTSERQAERLLELDQDETCSLSGRSTLSLAGLSAATNDSGLEKTHSSGGKRPHHHHHLHHGADPRLFSSHLRPLNQHDPNPSEVFDNLSDTSSHKGASGSFDVFDPAEGDSVFSSSGKNNFSSKRDFEAAPNGVPCNQSASGSSRVTLRSDYIEGDDSNNKPFNNSANSINSSSDHFTNPKFLQDLSDDSEAASGRELSCSKIGTNYGEGFEIFDPFAPIGTRSQARDLVKSTNSSSVDNLDALVTPNCDFFATSRASSSMTHIFDDPALHSAASCSDEQNFSQPRIKENKVHTRSELKKKSGLFGTFKEKLSKVNQASKRKTPRRTEDQCHEAPPVLIDFDGDSGGDQANSEGSMEQKSNSWKSEGSYNTETILAKYRSSPSSEVPTSPIMAEEVDGDHHPQENPSPDLTSTPSYATSPLFHQPPVDPWGGACSRGTSKPPGTLQGSRGADLFGDAKKKLRLVLSMVDCSQFKLNEGRSLLGILEAPPTSLLFVAKGRNSECLENRSSERGCTLENPHEQISKEQLIMFLKVLLADSIVADDRVLSTQLQETIRCLACFDSHEVKRLLKSLKEEYKMRSYYIAYLTRCKKSILVSMAFYEGLLKRVKRERSVVNKYLVSVMTRLYLEKRDLQIIRFISEFQRVLLFDEKSDLLDKFLYENLEDMRSNRAWKAASESQLDLAQLCMERTIMSHIYTQALFPNGDGDTLRDRKMEDHMRRLSRIMTPDNRYLKIPLAYHNECPWLAAQKELSMINAFKTPEDKLECVVRCCSTIMTLLSLALTGNSNLGHRSPDGGHKGSGDGEEIVPMSKASSGGGGVPAADDFMPVLIYVIIMSCTPNLLSTVQYVKSYCEKDSGFDPSGRGDACNSCRQRSILSSGEKLYWWMQFVAAVEFIKTMEYGE